MPANELIQGNEINRFVADFRNCREHGYERNCEQYATNRLRGRFPDERSDTIQSIVNHSLNALRYGNAAQQSPNDRTLNTFPGQDPADTQYGAGNRSQLRYRYQVAVNVQVIGGPNNGTVFPLRVIVNSRGTLTAGEVRSAAAEEALRVAESLVKTSDRLSDAELEVTADTRIESAYRDRV